VASFRSESGYHYFPAKDTLLNELYLALKLDMRCATIAGFPVTDSLRRRVQNIWTGYIGGGVEFRRTSTPLCASSIRVARFLHQVF
jgi:AcrR family transcriptional regulator